MSHLFIYGEIVNIQEIKKKEIKTEEEEIVSKITIHENISEKNLNNIYECSICCEEYTKDYIIFPCTISKNHHFCHSCFESWKNNCCKIFKDVTCPICRNNIPKNGKYTFYYENGIKRQEVDYVNDQPDGLVQIWTPEGILQKKFYTKNNKYNGLYEEYDIVGSLKQRAFYENGTFHGLFEEYYPNEILKVRCNYNKGSIYGTYQLFYNTSLLFLECQCGPLGGRMNGLFQVWNEDGELIEQYDCKNARININFDDHMNVSYSKKSGTFDPLPLPS